MPYFLLDGDSLVLLIYRVAHNGAINLFIFF